MSADSRRRAPRREAPVADGSEGLRSRRIALDILLEVEHRGGYADALLGTRIANLDPADRRLITRIVLGTLAWRGRLDHELKHLTGRDIAHIQPEALEIMRMGLMQIRFLDRIPKHAVVSTAVELAKRSASSKVAAGFINAVMRRAARETTAPIAHDAGDADALATEYSHPRWMVERFIQWFGRDDAARLMAANNEAAPNVIRLNLARAPRAEIIERLTAEGFEIADGGRAPEIVILKSAPRFDSASYRAGLFQSQSEASQIVARMLAPEPGATAIDCAAAPGGKTTHLAELVGESGRVIALDFNFAGLRHARALAARLRHRNVDFVRADCARAIPLRPRSMEFVLLDAPCTGLGTMREHPEIRWRVAPGDPARMAAIQARMLAVAAEIVRPGGVIVYSVCSIAPEEGESVIRGFIGANPDFEIDRHPPNFDQIKDLLDADGMMRTRPDIGAMDGFFAARCVRKRA